MPHEKWAHHRNGEYSDVGSKFKTRLPPTGVKSRSSISLSLSPVRKISECEHSDVLEKLERPLKAFRSVKPTS
jgi:hypothetical protein